MGESVTGTRQLAVDLVAEQDELDRIVAGLTPPQWSAATPSPGWTVADQIGHLTYFDRTARLAIEDPEGFVELRSELLAVMRDDPDGTAMDAATLTHPRSMSPSELLAEWRTGRAELEAATATLEDDRRVLWYGPPMGARSFLTARLMECWAHGQDVVDAVGLVRPSSDRLVHVAQLGVITRRWSYTLRGLEPPGVDIRVALDLPGGTRRVWGSETAGESISGPVQDFCLVVTQRRDQDDTDLVVTGPSAREWLHLAQAFAGRPTSGPVSGGASGPDQRRL